MDTGVRRSAGSLGATADQQAWAFYDQARDAGEIVWDEESNAWLITSYDLIKQVFLGDNVDWRTPHVWDPDHPPYGMTLDEWLRFNNHGSSKAIANIEGPDHDRAHRWWMRAFSPTVLAEWGDRLIEPIANAEIDRFVASGLVELRSQYCERTTPRVMAAVLGLPWDDDSWFDRFLSLRKQQFQVFQYQNPEHPPPRELIERGLAAMHELYDMVAPSILTKQSGEGDDFTSMVWRDAGVLFGEDYTTTDVVATTLNAFTAGTSTTADTAGNALYLVMTNSGLQERVLAQGNSAFKNLGEEAMRLYSPVEYRPRRAKHDTELGGVQIRKGEVIIALSAAGNRDPGHYPDPHGVELNRRSPRDHFAFSMGPRTCAGQSFARFALERIIAVALERLPGLRLDPDAEPPRYLGNAARSWRPLHARFDVGTSV
jgi:cytochrome P450